MSSLLIVAIAPLAVAGLICLVYLLGGSKRATLSSESEVLNRFQKDYPDWTGTEVRLSEDRHVAVLPSPASDQVGLVFAVGAVFVARLVNGQDIETKDDAAQSVIVHFHDFTAPDIEVPRALLAA